MNSREELLTFYAFNNKVIKTKNIPDSLIFWTQKNIGVSQTAKNDEIKPGTTVVSIGYPLSIGASTQKNSPVFRMSIIAQEIQPNVVFLIDGTSNSGNSGSPVFDIVGDKLVGMIFSGPNDLIDFSRQGME